MTFRRLRFARDLKAKIAQKQSVVDIGIWAYSVYLESLASEDRKFLRLLIDLGTMELGYEFAYTYEQLNKIADYLISGKDVVL